MRKLKKWSLIFFQIILFLVPRFIRLHILNLILPIKIDTTARIGYSIILARSGIIKAHAQIKHLNFINTIDYIELGKFSKIGNRNWITGSSTSNRGYAGSIGRECNFIIGEHTRITAKHFFDCNGGIHIGDFTTVAGKDSQFITHGIDIVHSIQRAKGINIGSHCLIGTRCLILMNSKLPNKCLLAAGAVLSKQLDDEEYLYGGVPAKKIKKLPSNSKYFYRKHGNVT